MSAASTPFRPCDRGLIAAFQRLFFCVVLALMAWLPASSFALAPQSTSWSIGNMTGIASESAACSAFAQQQGGAGFHGSYVKPRCDVVRDDGVIVTYGYVVGSVPSCPANSTVSGNSCVCTPPYVENADQTACVLPVAKVCKAGDISTVNFTEGFTRTSAEGDRAAVGPVNVPPASGTMCSAGCTISAQTSGPGVSYYVSQSPTGNGLYRRSIDMPAIASGASCTPGGSGADAAIKPNIPSPSCPGFVGEVNGKLGCYGTASSPISTTDLGRTTGPASIGNPSAGDKPTTGEGSGSGGSGRTPAVGDGGNAGGPSGAAGQAATGTVPAPVAGEVQAACGAPGQPPCAVDSSGLPEVDPKYGQGALGEGQKSLDDTLTGIQSKADKDTSWGLVPRWLTQSGSCSPTLLYTLPPKLGAMPISIDLCPHLPLIYTLMNLLWVVWTFGAIVSMVFRVTTAGGA